MACILGIPIEVFDLREAVDSIKPMLETSKTDQVVTVNPEFLVRAQSDSEFKQLLKGASLRTADGVGVSLFSKFRFSRATGVDLTLALAEEFETSSFSLFLFGGGKGVAKKAAQKLKKRYPNLEIAGTLKGFNLDTDSQLEAIKKNSPDILFVGLGAGKQERWIDDHKKELSSCKVAIGVGGAFDILAGAKPRAPKFFRRVGLEWLWRFFLEPSRAPRMYRAAIYFPYLVFKRRIVRLFSLFYEKD